MKTLKFRLELADMIMRGEKTTTFRIGDEKELKKGDIVSARVWGGDEFAKLELVSVKEKTFGELTQRDWNGHENFKTKKGMFDTYSKYYNTKVTPKTKLKVIKFKIIKE